MRLAAALLGTLVTLLAAPAAGFAATWVAGPFSLRETPPCTREQPCTLKFAAESALDGDDVLVLGGEYGDAGSVSVSKAVQVRGEAGSRPTITGSSFLSLSGSGAPSPPSIAHVELAGAGTLSLFRATGEDVVATGSSPGKTGVSLGTAALLRNSRVVVSGQNAIAVRVGQTSDADPARLVHVTAIATGDGSRGVFAEASAFEIPPCVGGPSHVRITNSILRGVLVDIEARGESSGGSCFFGANAIVEFSNYRTTNGMSGGFVNPGPGNQTSPAQTDDVAIFADDLFHQRLDSPTVDAAGSTPLAGDLDFDGDPRVAGVRADIGGDEVPDPPAVETQAASGVGLDGATLNALVTPAARELHVVFDYGPDPSYGSTTEPVVLPAGSGQQVVSSLIGGLPPGTTHHYRARVFDTGPFQARDATGADASFTTVALPAVMTGVTVRKRTSRKRLRRRGLRVVYVLGRPGTRAVATLYGPRRGSKRRVRIARSRVTHEEAGKARVRLRPKRRGIRKLRRRGRLTVVVKATAPGGETARERVRVRYRR